MNDWTAVTLSFLALIVMCLVDYSHGQVYGIENGCCPYRPAPAFEWGCTSVEKDICTDEDPRDYVYGDVMSDSSSR
ncbi:hypothetical protein HYW18_03610 [Candidatus Uhrbacteria bacterium]|nr:hypothetical protein [Candidatus Uhrbacteria bacterium]